MADEENTFDLEAVLAQAKENGVTLMTQDAFDKRFAKEAAKRDALQADLTAIKSQYEETHSELQKYLDKGKTEEQRRAEDTLKLEKQAKAYREQLAQEQARAAELQRQIKERDLERELSGVLQGKAANLRHATLIARTELQSLEIGEGGKLVYTDPSTEIPYEGDEALSRIEQWWEKQPHLHRATGNGGPPPANPKPNGDNKRPYSDLTDEERFARRHREASGV